MVFKVNEKKFTIPNFKMDYCQSNGSLYLDRPCSFQMNGFKYNGGKMTKKSNIPLYKESMENFNMYSPFFSSKAYSNVSSSILSNIIGGFVGSKSQMNNNKHNLSYDLSAAIYNLLNPNKYEKEKSSIRKNNDRNLNQTTSKVYPEFCNKYIGNKSSQENKKMKDCILDVMELQCLVSIPLHEIVGKNYVSDFQEERENHQPSNETHFNTDAEEHFSKMNTGDKCRKLTSCNIVCEAQCEIIPSKICTATKLEVPEIFSKKGQWTDMKDNSNKLDTLSQQPDVLIENCNSECSNNTEIKDYYSFNHCDIERKSKNKISCESSPVKTEIKYLEPSPNKTLIERFRKHSECSIDSTDSESFIVFDDVPDEEIEKKEDQICVKINSNDYNSDDENYLDYGSDEYDFCSIEKELTEANEKWLKNYEGVIPNEDETQRKVSFNDNVKINKIIAWDYAYRTARTGPWEQMARDRVRFQERIARLSSTISPVLEKEHRSKIYKKLYS